jgi:hypothetical protein
MALGPQSGAGLQADGVGWRAGAVAEGGFGRHRAPECKLELENVLAVRCAQQRSAAQAWANTARYG